MWSYMASALGITCQNEARHEPLPHELPSSNQNDGVNRLFFRLRSRGWLDRENELYVSIPRNVTGHCNILFFPGDVQDFKATMDAGPFAEYSDYSYETVAELLNKKFGDTCNVWVVRPNCFKHGAYSSFDNFVTTNEYGAATKYTSTELLFVYATDDPTAFATKHLASLVQNTQATLRRQGGLYPILCFLLRMYVNISMALPMHLLGFSKGGTVLNQLVTELVRYSFNKKRSSSGQIRQGSAFASTRQFFSAVIWNGSSYNLLLYNGQINSIHWLDSGNGLLEGAMPTEELALSVLSRYERLRLFVHVTPYQYSARTRPWVKAEVNSFVKKMKLRGADVQLIMYVQLKQVNMCCIGIYYEGDEDSLASHFHILHSFETDRSFKSKEKEQ
ncbi:hypothetical protein DD238_006150 [Peronospora effusa]|uniref:Uncharacterized protein n=1 Tax=Peronospora effusa TaxID=542832 RepID=A0A3M6VG93_9STRA|nr:hypothetical protein DD238_006150 [Peronospora effusa]RQM13531.1 hypothetical protein DD237_006571 [Peronospora effusa]